MKPRTVWRSPEYRRWLLWGLLAGTFLLVNVYRLSTAVVAESLMAAFDATGTQVGTLHAAFFFVYAVMQIPTGILVDRVGPRLTATAGAVTMNLGAIWFALADGYAAALGGRFVIGLGGSVIFVAILRFAANWFSADEFGTMNGLSFGIAGVGGILATTPFALLVGAIGWRTGLTLLGGVGLVLAVVTYLFVRDSPRRAGLESIEDVPTQTTLTLPEVRTHLGAVLRDRMTWVIAVLLFCTGGINLTLFGLWGIPYVVQVYDTTVTQASTLTLLGGVGIMVGPPAIGRVSDRTGRRTGFVALGAAVYAMLLGVIAVTGTPPLPLVGVVFFATGFLFGAFVLTYPLVRERHPDRASGVALGTINGASFFGAAAFPALMGRALDSYWTGELVGGVRVYTVTGYRAAFAIATAAGVVAAVCAAWIHWREQ